MSVIETARGAEPGPSRRDSNHFSIQPSQVQAACKTVGRNAQTGKPKPSIYALRRPSGGGWPALGRAASALESRGYSR
jgi:hypothetical protein